MRTVEIKKGDDVNMSEKRLSKEQLGVLKLIIKSEEGKSAKEVSDEQNVKNTDNFEAFGRAIIEQIKQQSMKEAEKVGGFTDEIVLDTRITISPGTSDEQEGWFSDVIDKAEDTFNDVKDTVGDAIDDVIKHGKKVLKNKDATKVCISFLGKKICYDVNPFN